MIKIHFVLDKREAYKRKKQIPVLCDVRYLLNGIKEHFRFSTGKTVNPKIFKNQTVRIGDTDAESKNQYFHKIKSTAERLYLEGVAKGEFYSPAEFKRHILDQVSEVQIRKTTLDYFDHYLEHLVARQKTYGVISAMKRLRGLLQTLNERGTSIRFEDINLSFETKFLMLLHDKKYNVNTRGGFIKRLKTFLNWCQRNNITQNSIYKNFKITEQQKEIIALTDLELDRIIKLDIPVYKHNRGGLALTRDWFVISTQTGLRYSDFKKVRKENIKPVQGGYDLVIDTQKTGIKVTIPISRILYSTLAKHDFDVPPPSSNQKYNKGLKTIAERAGISKEITSHTGRKTFCTTQYRKGTPTTWIMKISGHKTLKEFEKYIGVDGEENAELVRRNDSDFQISSLTA